MSNIIHYNADQPKLEPGAMREAIQHIGRNPGIDGKPSSLLTNDVRKFTGNQLTELLGSISQS